MALGTPMVINWQGLGWIRRGVEKETISGFNAESIVALLTATSTIWKKSRFEVERAHFTGCAEF